MSATVLGRSKQSSRQFGANVMVLPFVAHHQRQLRGAIVEGAITGEADRFRRRPVFMLGNQRQRAAVIDAGEQTHHGRGKLRHRREESEVSTGRAQMRVQVANRSLLASPQGTNAKTPLVRQSDVVEKLSGVFGQDFGESAHIT